MNHLVRISIALIALGSSIGAKSQDLNGSWKGSLAVGPQKLTIVFQLDKAKQTATMSVPEQGASGIPMTVNVLTEDSLNVSLAKLGINYAGKLTAGKIHGTFQQMTFKTPMDMEAGEVTVNRPQEPKPPYPYKTRNVSFDNPAAHATFAGTLTYPTTYKAGKRVPVVLMVTGSGAQNRDEELFGHKCFLVIADYLAHHGIASLRYDDRGTAKSTGVYKGSTTKDFADDARCGLSYLKSLKEFSRVGIMGHSEGGAIAFMLGAERKPDFIVSLAGPACKLDTLMMTQLNGLGRAQGLQKDMVQNVADARKFMLAQDSSVWTRYFLDMDLTPYVRAVKCPVLAVGGDKDLNVPTKLNVPALQNNLRKNKKNMIKTYPGLGHTFQPMKTGNPTEAFNVEQTFSPEVLADICEWINRL